MNPTGPWWSTPTFTLGGVLLTLLVTVWLDHRRGWRESRHRWTERKMELYSEFLDACDVVRNIRVWPVGRDADPAPTAEPFARVTQASRRSAYVAPAAVRDRLTSAVRAANRLVTTIDEVRATSTRGHSGGVDDRLRAGLVAASEEFDEAVDAFVTASRTDVDVVDRVS